MVRSPRLLLILALAALASAVVAYSTVGYVRHARQERGIANHAEQIFHAKSSVVAGNPQGDVSVVAFLDYNCPYCREGAPDLAKLIAQDGKVRLVLKELPVLGKDSEEVVRIALAAIPQGKYLELHQRLFAEPGRATKAKALRVAGQLGLDIARLEADMNDASITATLLDNMRLARDIGGGACRSISSATDASPARTATSMTRSPKAYPRSARTAAARPASRPSFPA